MQVFMDTSKSFWISPNCFKNDFSVHSNVLNLSKTIWTYTMYFSVLDYRKIVSSNTSHLEGHADFIRLYMKGISDPYVL